MNDPVRDPWQVQRNQQTIGYPPSTARTTGKTPSPQQQPGKSALLRSRGVTAIVSVVS